MWSLQRNRSRFSLGNTKWRLPLSVVLLSLGAIVQASERHLQQTLTPPLTITVGGTTQQLSEFSLYAGSQDKNNINSLEIVENGNRVNIQGNQWKALTLPSPIAVNKKTMLEFDFYIDEIAEEQAICLDENLSNDVKRCFQVAGTATPSDMFRDEKTTVEEGFNHYRIPIGLFVGEGTMQYLAFVQDYDAYKFNGTSAYSNIAIYDEQRADLKVNLDGTLTDLDNQVSFHGSQDHGNNYVQVSADGLTAEMHGNMWKAFPLPTTYEVTDSTILEFDFENVQHADFTSICLENDLTETRDKCWTVAEVQNSGHKDVPDRLEEGESEHFQIPYGHYSTGTADYLVLIQDNDANNDGVEKGDGISVFGNISIYERTPLDVLVNGISMPLSTQMSYSGSQDKKFNHIDTSTDGKTGTMLGNMWKALPLAQPYTITQDTVISFDFDLVEDSEFVAIGMDDDLDHTTEKRSFVLGGSDYDDIDELYLATPRTYLGGSTSYMIRVGEYFPHGTATYLTIVQDNDADKYEGESSLAKVQIFEAESCLKDTDFTLSFGECTLANFVNGIQGELNKLADPCINDAWMELFAMLGVNNRDEIAKRVGHICSSAYRKSNLRFDQVTLEEYQFNEELMDGGTKWNYEIEVDGGNDNILAKDAGRIKVIERDVAYNRGIEWPGHMHNFDECNLRAAMCCYVADRQAGNDGTCAAPYSTGCSDANPVDNSDLCYVDFSRSPRSGHVRDGYSIYGREYEGDLYCHGFAWGNEDGHAESALKGNSLFHVAMAKNLYERGYVEQVPGASMCGCVEYMPVVTEAACTELDVQQNVQVMYKADIAEFVAEVTITSISYDDCQEGDLSSHYDGLVQAGKATEEEKAQLDKILVGDGNCGGAINDFLKTKGLQFASGAPAR